MEDTEIDAIERRNADATAAGAMQSICGEYHCDCHNDVPKLIATMRHYQTAMRQFGNHGDPWRLISELRGSET